MKKLFLFIAIVFFAAGYAVGHLQGKLDRILGGIS